jgi:hypothetical protein
MNGGGSTICEGRGRFRELIPYVVVPRMIEQVS